MEDPIQWSADEVITAIRGRRITARSYILRVLNHAEQYKFLNAFITLLADQALGAADWLDLMISEGKPLPPLAGLAIVVKDNINIRGLPTTAGTPALQRSCPATTAPSVQKLIDAGAIVVGKTNMHELGYGATSINLASFAGPVRNPYAFDMIAGGSSGGTAAAISSRIVTCGLGTDTGGSCRIPAALTGIVGFRPSVGNGGSQRRYHDELAVVPISHTRDTIGPLGRSVADVTLLDSIITGVPRARPVELPGLRVGIASTLWSGLDERIDAVVFQARRRLEMAGVVLVHADLPGLLSQTAKVSLPILRHEALLDMPDYLEASGITEVTLSDIASQVASPGTDVVLDAVQDDIYGGDYDRVMGVERPALQAIYDRYFQQNDISAILFPATILPATAIDKLHGSATVSVNNGPRMDSATAYVKLTSPSSCAGLPGLVIPAGITADGLPVGLEIDGPVGSDDRLLGLGLSVEKLLGQLPPPTLPPTAFQSASSS